MEYADPMYLNQSLDEIPLSSSFMVSFRIALSITKLHKLI